MFHVTLIVNPFASRVDEHAVARVVEALQRVARVDTMVTERRGHATELAGQAADVDAVVVLGGDGVANEAVNGLARDIPFAALPGGGTSVFPRALGLPRDVAAAAAQVADALEAGRSRRITLGVANGRRFTFACGVGFDAAAVRRMEALGRRRDGRRPGDLAFTYELFRVLAESRFRLQPTLDVRGIGRAAAVLVANGDPYSYAGGLPLHVAPAARFELGLDVVAPVRVTAASVPRFVRYAFRGGAQEHARDVLYAHDLDVIEIVCDRPLPLQLDGEDLGDVSEVHVHAEREQLAVLV